MAPLRDDEPQRRAPDDRPGHGREAPPRRLPAAVGEHHARPGDAAAWMCLHERAQRGDRAGLGHGVGVRRQDELSPVVRATPAVDVRTEAERTVVVRARRCPAGTEPGTLAITTSSSTCGPSAGSDSLELAPDDRARRRRRRPSHQNASGRPRPSGAPSPPRRRALARSSPALDVARRGRRAHARTAPAKSPSVCDTRPRSPATSRARRRRRVTMGVPLAIASITGMPKPS